MVRRLAVVAMIVLAIIAVQAATAEAPPVGGAHCTRPDYNQDVVQQIMSIKCK
jgi:hypothetical protein